MKLNVKRIGDWGENSSPDSVGKWGDGASKFHSLEELTNLSLNNSNLLDPTTRHLILRLDEWLRWREERDDYFLRALFRQSPAESRIRHCTHNPALLSELSTCLRVDVGAAAGVAGPSSELEEEKRRANEVLAAMMAQEKCQVFILNPLFGFPLPYRLAKGQQLVSYYAKGRPEPIPETRGRGMSEALPSGSSSGSGWAVGGEYGGWGEEYPLHHAAYAGKPERIRDLLAQGVLNPNLPDQDSWMPIHYAAWYGQLSSMQSLLNYGNCDVNARTRNGSTALHFAAWCGRVYLLELLLTHPNLHIKAKDSSGKTALEFCECVPKREWQDCGRLLKAAAAQKLPKMGVELADGSNVMLPLLKGSDTTAADLHSLLRHELGLSNQLGRLFALWICSPSLELQLKAEHKPVVQLGKWKTKIIPKWSEAANPEEENPVLIFRRDAKVSLAYEKKVVMTDVVVSLLYHEAQRNYLRGLYPCSDHDTLMIAAITLQILHGRYDQATDKHHLANDRTLHLILPAHKIKSKSSLGPKIAKEHKELSSKVLKGNKSISALQYQFLSFCWDLRVYGCAFFNAMVYMSKPQKGAMGVTLGVNDFGLHLLHLDRNKGLFDSYPLASLSFTHQPDKPFLEILSKSSRTSPTHQFTLSTRQASQVSMLLKRLSEPRSESSAGSSRTDLSTTR